MKKWIVLGVALLIAAWWIAAAPRPENRAVESLVIDPATAQAIAAVDHSADFAAGLERLPSELPHFDDAIFLADLTSALVTGMDGKIWKVNTRTHAAQALVNVPLMGYGIHAVPGDPNHTYFCASHAHNGSLSPGAVGLYRLTLADRTIEAVVLEVPATHADREHPVVYADGDSNAPELRRDGGGVGRRALVSCDNLDVSEDGRRIYFTEPFDYADASANDVVDEAISLARNGRLWRYDVDSGSTRLIAEGFHFINGVLHDLHAGQPREESVLVTQTFMFRLTRFYVRGAKAGTAEIVLDGLTGMVDGLDRDPQGRIWLALFAERGAVVTWLHAHAWLKPLFMRFPKQLLLRQRRRTGVVIVTPDGRTPLYAAMYQGPVLTSVASYVAGPDGIYLADEPLGGSDAAQGLARLKWPQQLPR